MQYLCMSVSVSVGMYVPRASFFYLKEKKNLGKKDLLELFLVHSSFVLGGEWKDGDWGLEKNKGYF